MNRIPDDRRYAKTHEWAMKDGDFIVVGITDHAQHLLGDIVYVEAPEKGRMLTAGEDCCVIESVKAASDVYTPISGEVVAVNSEIIDEPQCINSAPYDSWIFRIKASGMDEFDELLSSDDYGNLIAEE